MRWRQAELEGTLTFASIDSTSPSNPPDFSINVISPNDTVRPIYYEYNVELDEQMPWRTMLSVAFTGSHDVNLGSYNGGDYNNASNLNIVCGIEAGCPQNNNPDNPQNNFFTVNLGDLPSSMTTLQAVAGGISVLDTPETDFYRPYPFYSAIYQLKHDFYSNYNSLQVAWNKTQGFVQFGANYTFSKDLAVGSSYNNSLPDPVNLRNDYNPVPFDRTQVFNIHYLLDQTVRFQYKGNNPILRQLANGWQISGISTAMSGFPLASEEGENFGFGYGEVLPVQTEYQNQSNPSTNAVCEQDGIATNSSGSTFCTTEMSPIEWLGTPDTLLMPTIVAKPSGGKIAHQFINPLAFGLSLPETNGVFRIPYIHGPAYIDHDLSVMKTFNLSKGKNLRLRVEGFNFPNHPLVSFNNEDTDNLDLSFLNATAGQALTPSVLTYQDFGVANIKVGNRLMELEAKYTF